MGLGWQRSRIQWGIYILCCPHMFPIEGWRNQPDSSFVIISFILVTHLFYKALISQREFWCWSLLPVCNSRFHGLWTSGGASHGKILSLSTSFVLRRMLQCPLCSKSLSVGLSLVTHLSIEFHWWCFVYLAILIMFCQTSSFFFSELLTKKRQTNKQTNKHFGILL